MNPLREARQQAGLLLALILTISARTAVAQTATWWLVGELPAPAEWRTGDSTFAITGPLTLDECKFTMERTRLRLRSRRAECVMTVAIVGNSSNPVRWWSVAPMMPGIRNYSGPYPTRTVCEEALRSLSLGSPPQNSYCTINLTIKVSLP
jgi:hypothetical protein